MQGSIVDPDAYSSVDFGDYGHILMLQAIRIDNCEVVDYLSSLGFTLDYNRLYAGSNVKQHDELLYLTGDMRATLDDCVIQIYETRKEWEGK